MQHLRDAWKDAASSPDSRPSPGQSRLVPSSFPWKTRTFACLSGRRTFPFLSSLPVLPRSSPTSSRSSLGRGRGLRFSKHGLTDSPGTRPALLDYKSSAELDTTPAKVTLSVLIKLSPEEKLGLGSNNIGPRFHLFRRDPSRKYVRSRGA